MNWKHGKIEKFIIPLWVLQLIAINLGKQHKPYPQPCISEENFCQHGQDYIVAFQLWQMQLLDNHNLHNRYKWHEIIFNEKERCQGGEIWKVPGMSKICLVGGIPKILPRCPRTWARSVYERRSPWVKTSTGLSSAGNRNKQSYWL